VIVRQRLIRAALTPVDQTDVLQPDSQIFLITIASQLFRYFEALLNVFQRLGVAALVDIDYADVVQSLPKRYFLV